MVEHAIGLLDVRAEDLLGVIDTSRGDVWFVDTKHPTWRARVRPHLPKPTPSVDASEALKRWLGLYARSYLPVPDPAAEFRYLSSLADGMGCSCDSHWHDHLRADPPAEAIKSPRPMSRGPCAPATSCSAASAGRSGASSE